MVHAGCVFVASIHPSRTIMSGSFQSVRWNACVHRLDLGLYSHPRLFLGKGVRTHVNSKGKIPSTGKFSSEEDQTHDAVSSRTASPTHYQRAIPASTLLINTGITMQVPLLLCSIPGTRCPCYITNIVVINIRPAWYKSLYQFVWCWLFLDASAALHHDDHLLKRYVKIHTQTQACAYINTYNLYTSAPSTHTHTHVHTHTNPHTHPYTHMYTPTHVHTHTPHTHTCTNPNTQTQTT